MPQPPRILLAALAASVLAGAASATTMVRLDTRALARGSQDIVIGQVTGTSARWNDDRTRIVTEVRVRVERALKGAAAAELVLTQPGGELDGFRYSVEGAPHFRAGEEALLFVWRDAAGRATVNGLAQGKFDIRRDPASGVRTVRRAAAGLGIGDARSLRAAPQDGREPVVTLDELVREIERTLAEGGR
uniref:Uncharacterized protein n=1 Tax=Eiseniibacteriota bacterium TaxID=2212470 RepID=A0A832I532_UNCEI